MKSVEIPIASIFEPVVGGVPVGAVVGCNSYVAVVDQQVLIAGARQHLLQGGNLAIRSAGRRALKQLDGAIGKLLSQFAHCSSGGIVEVCHPED